MNMTVSIENTQGLGRRLSLTIPSEDIKKAIQKELINTAKKVKIDGFRKGKVPLNIVENRYGQSIVSDVLSELMQQFLIKAIVQEKLNIAGTPTYIPSEYNDGADYAFSVEFEVYPVIEVKGLDKIKIEKPVANLSGADVENMLNTLRKQQGQWKQVDAAVDTNHRIQIDFVGSIDGTEFEGGKANDFTLVMGQGNMIPGFEDAILGHKQGDVFDINVKFPDDYHVENLKGNEAVFKTTLKKVEELELAELTESVIKKFGIADGTLESLQKEVKRNMERELSETIKNRVKLQAIDGLIEQNQFDLPKSLINKEVDTLHEQALSRFGEKNKQADSLPKEIFEPEAKKRVSVGLLFSQIIEDNDFNVDNDKVTQLVNEIATAYEDPKEVIEYYTKDKKASENLKSLALEDQVVDFILSKAQVTEKDYTFAELMNQNNQ